MPGTLQPVKTVADRLSGGERRSADILKKAQKTEAKACQLSGSISTPSKNNVDSAWPVTKMVIDDTADVGELSYHVLGATLGDEEDEHYEQAKEAQPPTGKEVDHETDHTIQEQPDAKVEEARVCGD